MISKYDESKCMDYENGFYLTSYPSRLGNILAHYELYKRIVDLPGDVVELGVFKGGSLIQFATFRELIENENSRKIIGFDVFGEFPDTNNEADRKFREKWIHETNNEFLDEKDICQALELKEIGNVDLIKGDIMETLHKYVEEHPHLRIALLHIDTDIYEPAKEGLELLWDKIVRGGVIILDDYGIAGETEAVDEFFANRKVAMHKLSLSHNKPSYIIKE